MGTYCGRSRWPGTRKSLEGTASGFVGVIVCTVLLHCAAAWSGLMDHIIHVTTFEARAVLASLITMCACHDDCVPVAVQIIQFSAACACACLLETFTKQVDNLILPLYFYGTLVLLSPRA